MNLKKYRIIQHKHRDLGIVLAPCIDSALEKALITRQIPWSKNRQKGSRIQKLRVYRTATGEGFAYSLVYYPDDGGWFVYEREEIKIKHPDRSQRRRKRRSKQLRKKQKNLCGICGEPLQENLTLDHIKPKSFGGSGKLENMQIVHEQCNQEKSDIWEGNDELQIARWAEYRF